MFISKIVVSSKNYVLLRYNMGKEGLGLGRGKGTLESYKSLLLVVVAMGVYF